MKIDLNIGGGLDGTVGGTFDAVRRQVDEAWECSTDGVWTTEVNRDPFLPLLLAAEHAPGIAIGTAVTVAFARSPMTLATVTHDLQAFSRGRLLLGLGTQIRAHVERRFSMPWSAPAERLTDYIGALRAIWQAWETGERLRYEGRFYRHTLMTPTFTPEPHGWGPPPILVAAVGPRMTRVAAGEADGLIVHGFTTAAYLTKVTLPLVEETLAVRGRSRADFVVSYPGMVATGVDEQEQSRAIDAVRAQIAFYGATPAYRGVLDLHGWGDLHEELHRLSLVGEWAAMRSLIDDEVLAAVAVVGTPEQAGAEIAARYGHLVDRFTLYAPYALSLEARSRVTAAVRAGLA